MGRYFKKIVAVFFAVVLFSALGVFLWARTHYVVPILMYHHVNGDGGFQLDTVSVDLFDWQMDYLKKHHYHVISLADLVKAIRAGRPVPHDSVVITFDDGYDDNYIYAYKILRKYQFPATIFVVSDRVGTPGFLTQAQMEEMAAHNIAIGSHTRTHKYLPGVSPTVQREEIVGSKHRLEELLGREVDYFAYPSGGFSRRIAEMVRDAGYAGACATNRGYDRFNKDVYQLNRVRLSDKDNRIDYLWIKLSGMYNLFRQARDPY